MFQFEEKAADKQQMKKLVYTGPSGKFVPKDFVRAKVDKVPTLSPEVAAKRETDKKAKDRATRLKKAIAEGKAKLSAKRLAEQQEQEATTSSAVAIESGKASPKKSVNNKGGKRKSARTLRSSIEIIDCTESDDSVEEETPVSFGNATVMLPKMQGFTTVSCSSTGPDTGCPTENKGEIEEETIDTTENIDEETKEFENSVEREEEDEMNTENSAQSTNTYYSAESVVPIVPLVNLMTSDEESATSAENGEQKRVNSEKSGKDEITVEEYVQNMLQNAVSSGKEVPLIPLTIQPEKSLPRPILETSAFVSAPTSAFEDSTKGKEKVTDKKPDEFSGVGTKARLTRTKMLSNAYNRAIVPKSIVLKNANDKLKLD